MSPKALLQLQPLTAESLAPLATLIRGVGGLAEVPQAMEHDDVPGRSALSVLTRPATPLEGLSLTWLERHPHSAQTFVPIKAGRWMLVLVPDGAGGLPDLSAAKAYLAGPEDAVVIHQNVWHAGMTVFDEVADFAMLMWKTEMGEIGRAHV